MEKRILIVSIIAVVILVLVSFTGVVGYKNIESDVKISPLFNIRSSKAIGKESKDITCNYIGRGEKINILFSSRIKRAEQAQKAVDIISKMNDRAFKDFVARIIPYLKNHEKMADKETSEVLQALHYIRENPNVIKNYDTKNNPKPETWWIISCDWFPGCILFLGIIESLTAIGLLTMLILSMIWAILLPTQWLTCKFIPHFCTYP